MIKPKPLKSHWVACLIYETLVLFPLLLSSQTSGISTLPKPVRASLPISPLPVPDNVLSQDPNPHAEDEIHPAR